MKIMIAGSSNWIDQNIIVGSLMRASIENPGQNIELVHIGTPGAEQMAAQVWAEQRDGDVTLIVPPIELGRRGRKATYTQLAESCDAAIVFVRNGDPDALFAARVAHRAGLPMKLHRVDDMPETVGEAVL